jgi:hypothetical protein
MGSVNNGKVLKPGGAGALAAEYRKNMPKGSVGAWGGPSLDGRQIFTKKKDKAKDPAPVRG